MGKLMVICLLLPMFAFAVPSTEDATKDAAVYEIEPDTNHGADGSIGVQTSSDDSVASFIAFDVSGYMGQTVTTATLYLYCWLKEGTNDTLWFAAASNNWDETGVTWNNKPGVIGGTENSTWSSSTGWWSCNVTGIVQSWLNSAYSNNGFTLYCEDGPYGKVYFNSREHTSDTPYLEINIATGIEASSLSRIKAAFK